MEKINLKLRHIPYYGSVALLIYMPFHIFLSQWLSTFTGGLDIWKGAKDALTFALLVVAIGLVAWRGRNTPKMYWYLVFAGGIYGLLHVVLHFANKDTSLSIAGLATVYNCRLIAYAIIGWSAALLTPEKLSQRKLVKIIVIISTVVCAIGLLQLLLPKDILTHFGYSVERGVKPWFYIDNKPDLVRIMSTIREPNSLGAYLILPILLLLAAARKGNDGRKMLLAGLIGLHGLILFSTHSRSAWIGLVVAGTSLLIIKKGAAIKENLHIYILVPCVALLMLGGIIFALRDQYFVQNIVFHSDENTVSGQDSNENHVFFAKEGFKAIVAQPFGHGPGTAGPVSMQGANGGFITENYFLQIGYEVGVLGLGMFIFISLLMARVLYRSKTELANTLLAAFIGLMTINLLLHAWVNEAVAAQWWLLAGLCLGAVSRNDQSKSKLD